MPSIGFICRVSHSDLLPGKCAGKSEISANIKNRRTALTGKRHPVLASSHLRFEASKYCFWKWSHRICSRNWAIPFRRHRCLAGKRFWKHCHGKTMPRHAAKWRQSLMTAFLQPLLPCCRCCYKMSPFLLAQCLFLFCFWRICGGNVRRSSKNGKKRARQRFRGKISMQ